MTSPRTSAAARPWRARFAALHPNAYLGAHGLVGAAACILMLWAFSYIADEMTEQSLLVRVDHVIVGWLAAHSTEGGERFFNFMSWIGSQVMNGIVILGVGWLVLRRDWFRAVALTLAVVGGSLLNDLLKALFHRGRPETATEFIRHESWSFPSGHSMNSLIGFGFVAYLFLERTEDRRARIAIMLATLVLVGLVGFSRLYLGVHYLSDVIAGFLAGAVWLLVCVAALRVAERQRASRRSTGVPDGDVRSGAVR
ncbi:MAG: phosphatase PAP2 family protein [Gemmatimonadaceae bacterium]